MSDLRVTGQLCLETWILHTRRAEVPGRSTCTHQPNILIDNSHGVLDFHRNAADSRHHICSMVLHPYPFQAAEEHPISAYLCLIDGVME